MSCWVVPAIAAELWGLPLEEVLRRIHAGSVATRREGDWMFVDVAPDSPVYSPQAREKPPTYTPLSPQEYAALVGEAEQAVASAPVAVHPGNEKRFDDTAPLEDSDEAEEAGNELDEHTADLSWRDWHHTRSRVGRSRRPPLAA